MFPLMEPSTTRDPRTHFSPAIWNTTDFFSTQGPVTRPAKEQHVLGSRLTEHVPQRLPDLDLLLALYRTIHSIYMHIIYGMCITWSLNQPRPPSLRMPFSSHRDLADRNPAATRRGWFLPK